MRWNRVFWVGAVVVAGVVLTGIAEACYEDVTVSGAGAPWANATLSYREMYNGRPLFEARSWVGDIIHYVYAGFEAFGSGGVWFVTAYYEDRGTHAFCVVSYINHSHAATLPQWGWTLYDCSAGDCGGISGLPAPRVSGGEPCGDLLRPCAACGFLDRCLPDEEALPRVGEVPVAAVYEVGEIIAGACATADATGAPVDVSPVTLTWYAVTIADPSDIREPIDTRVLRADPDGVYRFALETAALPPGIYDLRLGSPGADSRWIRVLVVEAIDESE